MFPIRPNDLPSPRYDVRPRLPHDPITLRPYPAPLQPKSLRELAGKETAG